VRSVVLLCDCGANHTRNCHIAKMLGIDPGVESWHSIETEIRISPAFELRPNKQTGKKQNLSEQPRRILNVDREIDTFQHRGHAAARR